MAEEAALSDDAPTVVRVVLDSCILIANFRPSNAFITLLDGARTQQVDVVVPELAFREAINKYRERLHEARTDHEKALARFAALGIAVRDVAEVVSQPAARRSIPARF